jgi:uncharacterized protein YecT (DUF1311 family)
MKVLFALFLSVVLARAQLTTAAPAVQTACAADYTGAALPADIAGLAVPATYPKCDSYALYEKRDFQRARLCAIAERGALLARLPDSPANPQAADEANDGGEPAGGLVVLAQLYANGEGVSRQPALAARFLCEAIDTNEVEHDADAVSTKKILDTLGRVRGIGEDSSHFALCVTTGTDFPDTTTSQPPDDTPQTRYCIRKGDAEWESQYPAMHMGGIESADQSAQKDADDAAAALNPALTRLTAGQQDAYRRLLAALDGFLNKQVTRDSLFCPPYSACDVPGSGELARNEERAALDTQVSAILSVKPVAGNVASLSQLDAELNRAYRDLMAAAAAGAAVPHARIAPEMLREEQRAWLVYREAFVRFGHAVYPDLPATTWLSPLTAARTSDLKQVYESTGKRWIEDAARHRGMVAESVANATVQADAERAKVAQYFDHQTPPQAAAWQRVQAALANLVAAHKAAAPNASPTDGQRRLDALYGELYAFQYNRQHGFARIDPIDSEKAEEGFAANEQRLKEAYEQDLKSACLFLPVRGDAAGVHRTVEGLRAEQAAWLKLREAWVGFLATLFPEMPKVGLGNMLTGARAFELKMLDESCQRSGQAPKEQ